MSEDGNGRGLEYNRGVFARRLKVEVIIDGERRPCPLDWLDSFSMRRFTGEA
ncbi:MAG: hypothetical protein HYY26_01585, partial [Acidobacteria bacterium]|nr:hypothetical protein [Acidobacteriota bacterium]